MFIIKIKSKSVEQLLRPVAWSLTWESASNCGIRNWKFALTCEVHDGQKQNASQRKSNVVNKIDLS